MSWWLLWPISGLLSAGWLWFVMTYLIESKSEHVVDEITLGNALTTIGIVLLGMLGGPIVVFFAIFVTWEELNFNDIIIWKRKPMNLQKEAKKRGYELKPLKGMDDA